MDFNNIKCPVCGVEFKDGDDIVVCPECGAPHHRACYEAENRCAFEDRHAEGFEFGKEETEESAQNENVKICPRCQSRNAPTSFYCNKCGAPLDENAQGQNFYNQTNQTNNQRQGYGMPFQNANPFAQAFDPMGGIDPETDIGDGVTAGEVSKFTRNNTPYFTRVFNNIKQFGKSRINFSAFVFSECYFLYRKMYKLGAIVAAISLALMTVEIYISYSSVSTALNNAIAEVTQGTASYNQFTAIMEAYNRLDPTNQMWIMIMSLCSVARLALRIIVGLTANRAYYNHCRRTISRIKAESDNPQQDIETKGGVNTALAASILAAFFAINYIPDFIKMFI